jgi:hypothetical protein
LKGRQYFWEINSGKPSISISNELVSKLIYQKMKPLPSGSTGSFTKGLWFVHTDGSNVIKAWASGMNGKQEVYLNDSLVSESRNIHLKNEHTFNDQNDQYKVDIIVTNIRKGELECQFYKNNLLLKAYKSEFAINRKKLKAVIMSCAIFGVLAGLFTFPVAYWFVFLSLALISVFLIAAYTPVLIKEIAVD